MSSYISSLAETVNIKKSALGSDIACKAEITLATLLSSVCDALYTKSHELENALAESDDAQMNEESARYFCDVIIPLMTEIRTLADELEVNTASEFWPMPTYGDLLFA